MNKNVYVDAVREVQVEGQKPFVALDLVQLQFVTSKVTGREYLGKVRASITTTISPELAKTFIGTTLPGTIVERDLPKDKHRIWENPRTKEKVTITKERIYQSAK